MSDLQGTSTQQNTKVSTRVSKTKILGESIQNLLNTNNIVEIDEHSIS